MNEHEPFVPPGSVGDFRCQVCTIRLGSFQLRPGQAAVLVWDDAVSPACVGKPAKRSTTDEKIMHTNCRDETLTWWLLRQARHIDRLAPQ